MSFEISRMEDDLFRELSSLYDHLAHLNTQLRAYLKTLQTLEIQLAKYGPLNAPPHLSHQIDSAKSEIKRLQEESKRVVSSISEIKRSIVTEEQEKRKLSQREVKALLADFWQIQDGEPLFCAVSTLWRKKEGLYKRPMTGFGEIKGYASVLYSLARAYKANITKDAMLFFSDMFPMNVQLESSLILLGGDDKNSVTRGMFEQFEHTGRKLPFYFKYVTKKDEKTDKKKETGIKNLICEDEEGKKTEYKPLMQNDKILEDFGVVARLPNPFNPHHAKLFVFAGCHTFGTAAAAKVVAAKSILKRIEAECSCYQKSKFFVAAIHTRVIDYSFFHIDRMEVFYPLDEETLKPIPEGIVENVRFFGSPLDN